jgi:hypothetical protein
MDFIAFSLDGHNFPGLPDRGARKLISLITDPRSSGASWLT